MKHMRETAAADSSPEYRVKLEHDFVVFISGRPRTLRTRRASLPLPR